jgi:hypothetical protein
MFVVVPLLIVCDGENGLLKTGSTKDSAIIPVDLLFVRAKECKF